MQIIKATEKNINQIKALYNNLIIAYPHSFVLTEYDAPYDPSKIINDTHTFILIALEGEELIGMVEFKMSKHYKRRFTGLVEKFGVLPNHRNKGVGSALIKEIINVAKKELNIHRLELYVNSSSIEAIRLYKKFGFIEEGKLREVTWENDKFEDSLLMGLILE